MRARTGTSSSLTALIAVSSLLQGHDEVELLCGMHTSNLTTRLVIVIPEERMRVLCEFAIIWDLNAGPAQLLDGDERLGDVGVLRHEERAEMQGEFLGVEDVGRDLGEVCEEDQITGLSGAPRRTVRDVLD